MTQGLASATLGRVYRPAQTALERWTGMDAYEILAREAEGVPAGHDGLIFLPYLQGQRTAAPGPLRTWRMDWPHCQP